MIIGFGFGKPNPEGVAENVKPYHPFGVFDSLYSEFLESCHPFGIIKRMNRPCERFSGWMGKRISRNLISRQGLSPYGGVVLAVAHGSHAHGMIRRFGAVDAVSRHWVGARLGRRTRVIADGWIHFLAWSRLNGPGLRRGVGGSGDVAIG